MVPSGVKVLTCGVDVQKSRLIFDVRGWGYRAESWLIESGELWGETDREAVWSDLAALLDRDWDGKRIRRMAIDSGYRPGDKWKRPDHMVYGFARQYAGRVIATKSHDTQSKPLSPSMIDVTVSGRLVKNGLQLWHIDSDYFKSWVHARLQWPSDQPDAWHVPQDVTDDYCQQVTAEARVSKPSGRVVWVRIRGDNHHLDCEALNVAAAHSLGIHRMREKPKPDDKTIPEPAPLPVPTPLQERMQSNRRPLRRPGGWMTR